MTVLTHQLPLQMHIRDDSTFASYFPGNNLEIFKILNTVFKQLEAKLIYIWGATGLGKTHLLQAVCHAANNQGLGAMYLPLDEHLNPCILHGLEKVKFICLDDVHLVLNNPLWRAALIKFIGKVVQENGKLVMAGQVCNKNETEQADALDEFLANADNYSLESLSNDEKLEAIQLRAHCRGLLITDNLGKFLLSRCPGSMQDLFELLEKLDEAALIEKHRLTIPFVKQALGL